MRAPPPFRSIATLAITAALLPAGAAVAQQEETSASKTEAQQIGAPDGGTTASEAARRVFIDEAPVPRARPSLMQAEGDPMGGHNDGSTASTQITAAAESARRMPQLSRAELDATLAQLTPAERRVLLQAIEGTDICENPPAVPAIVALCQTRIETRSGEFAATPEKPLTAEERLMRGDVENNGLPSVEAVISRLSRVTVASSDDFNNQAIASVALAPPPAPDQPGDEDGEAGLGLGLGSETEALINAIVQQLGGGGVGGQP
jgi:hypothetical protein